MRIGVQTRVMPALACVLVLGGCAAAPPAPVTQQPATPAVVAQSAPTPAPVQEDAQAEPSPGYPAGSHIDTPAYMLSVVQADSDLIDSERLPSARVRLVADAQGQAERCLTLAPQDGQCHYARGIVYGLAAREEPLKAGLLLQSMLASLARAESLAPTLDHAGPARLQAIVLLRAPSWPLGPGDNEAALEAAKRALALEPDWPANQALLQETQRKIAK